MSSLPQSDGMPRPVTPAARAITIGSFTLISVVALFLGFYRNQWNVVREKKFKEFQLDSESLVIARMVESRQSGILSENGLLGWGDANPLNLNQNDYNHQFEVYLSGGTFQTYALYKSVGGYQAMIFSALDHLRPQSPALNLRDFRAMVALLMALTLSIFMIWVHREFGWVTALTVLVTTILSQWITLFGHNLFYFMWASFLPLGLMVFYLEDEARRGHQSDLGLASVGFGTALFKCLMNGYDFIIPALSMPVIPLLYYGFRDGWDRKHFVRRLLILGLALLGAVGTSLVILGMQLQVSEGTVAGGLASVFSTFSRRTYADPSLYPLYADSLMANPWSVLWTYISEDLAIGVLGVSFLGIILIFVGFTLIYVIVDRRGRLPLPGRGQTYALIATTWLSILSPVSWFLIFKGQAYVHTFTNYLAWHMPFTLFGYAMCGFILRSIVASFMPGGSGSPASIPAQAR